jgi:hypothetical protein
VKGGLNFGKYDAKKHMGDVGGRGRMAGDIFQKTFGDEGWNKGLLLKTPEAKNVNRNPALDGVANQIAEKEYEAEMAEYNEKYGF